MSWGGGFCGCETWTMGNLEKSRPEACEIRVLQRSVAAEVDSQEEESLSIRKGRKLTSPCDKN